MTVTVHHGDSREVLKSIADCSIDSCVTDPPYALVSIVKRFGGANAAPARDGDVYARASAGFMGKKWDTGETAFDPAFWAEVWRVLKPGAHLIAFSGTRTYHRMACAIEDAGFEIRDQVGWLYGSGFPKSHNQSGEWEGWGSALKPAWEPICLARKPLIGTIAANLEAHRTGALNIDGCRVGSGTRPLIQSDRRLDHNTYSPGLGGSKAMGETSLGRWPANVIQDGSEEVIEAFPASESPPPRLTKRSPDGDNRTGYGAFGGQSAVVIGHGDSGSAARFFYSAKADAADRLGSKHPTVKPVDLMAYLCRLVTPPGGLVLDPFAGSGTTGMACLGEGFNAVLIEREAEYVADINRRLAHVAGEDTPLFAPGNDPDLFANKKTGDAA